jgi:hypothetical protein
MLQDGVGTLSPLIAAVFSAQQAGGARCSIYLLKAKAFPDIIRTN